MRLRFADETGSYAIFAGLNNHYYRVVANDTAIEAFIPVDEDFADNGEAVADEERVATLTSIVDEYKDFFGFTYTQTEFTDATFIGDGTHDTFELSFTLGGNGEPAPSAVPSSEPTPNPNPVPSTGAVSIAVAGIISMVGGAAALLNRKRK